MTNTARIGARYELAYIEWLRGLGMHTTARQAGSKGLFDLVAWQHLEPTNGDPPTEPPLPSLILSPPVSPSPRGCWHIQLKSKRMSCSSVVRLHGTLRQLSQLPVTCGVVVVHKTKQREYCEH